MVTGKIIFNLKRLWEIDGEMRDLYEMIRSGEKTSEWRDLTDRWGKKLRGAEGKRAWFVVGYPKDSLPRLEADIVEVVEHRETLQYEIRFTNVSEVLAPIINYGIGVTGKHPDAVTKILVPDEFKPLLEDIRCIVDDGDNPNVMDKGMMEAVWVSLQRFGWFKPILVDSTGILGDGAHRIQICLEQGEYYAPILRMDMDEIGRRLLRQVSNRQQGQDNPEKLKLEIKKIDISLAVGGT